MKTVWNNSRTSDTQRGKGERRTDRTPRPETGSQKEQKSGEKLKPNNVLVSEQAAACSEIISH